VEAEDGEDVTLFADSSALYALFDASDTQHERAVPILTSGEPVTTSDHVLVESWLLVHVRLGQRLADRFWQGIREGGVAVEPVTHADLEVAWRIGEDFPDQGFSIVDRTSFAVMQRLGVYRVAAFDNDFAVFRFGPHRQRAFEIVR
jgi:predicted nucleic acid-binding protein